MDKHLYKSLKEITSLATHFEDENSLCPQALFFRNKFNYLPIVSNHINEDLYKILWDEEARTEKHTELALSRPIIQQIFYSRLCNWSKIVEFTDNCSNTFICIEWKGCRTSSREATPLGDPRGVPKFTNCDFLVFHSDFLDCSKVGQLSKSSTVKVKVKVKVKVLQCCYQDIQRLAYSCSKVGDLEKSYSEIESESSTVLLSRHTKARLFLLQGWRFGEKLSAYLSDIKQFLSRWIVLVVTLSTIM